MHATIDASPDAESSEHPWGKSSRTVTAAEYPRLGRPLPWPASQQRSWWAVEQPGEGGGDQLAEGIAGDRLPVHSHPHPRFACTHLGLAHGKPQLLHRHDGAALEASCLPPRPEQSSPLRCRTLHTKGDWNCWVVELRHCRYIRYDNPLS